MRKLLCLFTIAVLTKIAIISFVAFSHPLIVMDETLYFLQAKEIWTNQTYILHGKTFGAQYPPLYPLLLSPLTLIADVNLRYMSGLVINAILSSLLIFPVFEIAKMYLNERRAFIVSAITVFAPVSLTYSFVWMSENLYFLLFAYSVLWILRKEEMKTGFGIGLTALTKVIGVALIPFMIWKFRRKSIIPLLIAISLISIHFLLCLNETGEATGYHYSPSLSSSSSYVQLFLAFTYLSCATAPALLNLQWKKYKDLIILCASYTILVAVASKLPLMHGRYYECLIPLLLIPVLDVVQTSKTQRNICTAVIPYLVFFLPCLAKMDIVNASVTSLLFIAQFSAIVPFALVFTILYIYAFRKTEKNILALMLVLLILIGSSITNLYHMSQFSVSERECNVFSYLKNHNNEKIVFAADKEEWWANYCLCCFYAQQFIPLSSEGDIIIKEAKHHDGQKHIARLEKWSEDEVLICERR